MKWIEEYLKNRKIGGIYFYICIFGRREIIFSCYLIVRYVLMRRNLGLYKYNK